MLMAINVPSFNILHSTFLLPKAAHYSSPVRFRFANYMQPRSRFWDVCTYGFRFMTFFDVTEILKNITYSR